MSTLLTLMLSLGAFAAPPNSTPALVPVGTGVVDDVEVSPDGSVVIGRDRGTGQAFLLYVEDWSWTNFGTDACDFVLSVAWYDLGLGDGSGDIWIGCEDGTLHAYGFYPETGEVARVAYSDGTYETIDLGDPVNGLWFSNDFYGGTGRLYSLDEAGDGGGGSIMHSIEPYTDNIDLDSGYPINLTFNNFEEGVLLWDEQTLVIHHASQNLTTLTLNTAAAFPTYNVGANFSPVDIAPGTIGVYGVSNQGMLAEFAGGLWTTLRTGLDDPNGVVSQFNGDDSWVAVTGGSTYVWELDYAGGGYSLDPTSEPWFEGSSNVENYVQDGTAYEDYLYGGGTAGNLHISTSRPWINPSDLVVEPDAGTDGDEVTLNFSLDEAGDWDVYLGGNRYGTGSVVASGYGLAGETQTVSMTIDLSWAEGDNYLYVIQTGFMNTTGHARTSVFVDNPPKPPTLERGDLEFGDRQLILDFQGISDADLDVYEVYVSNEPFEAEDFPDTGGPAYSLTGFTSPKTVSGTPSARTRVTLKPLTNDIKHYVAVRAIDEGGLVGSMSNVISETPRPTYTAAELAGETGGPACNTAPGSSGLAVTLLAMLAGLRRRSTALLLSASLLPGAALAQDSNDDRKDMTRQRGNFEMRYGGISLADPIIRDVYSESTSNILQVEFGPQFFRFFELDFGVAFFQELASKVSADGVPSGERTMLTWWPSLTVDGTARLQIFDEQILVPHARLGGDLVVWSEKADNNAGGKDIVRGSKFGNHFGFGGSLLLDTFQKKRASLLEAQTGINDTYIVFEWRRQRVDQRNLPWSPTPELVEGLDFSGDMFTVGLKLDY